MVLGILLCLAAVLLVIDTRAGKTENRPCVFDCSSWYKSCADWQAGPPNVGVIAGESVWRALVWRDIELRR